MATPEKALVDVLYLTSAKSNLFKSLPELEFDKSFNFKLAEDYINNISSSRMKTIASRRLDELQNNK